MRNLASRLAGCIICTSTQPLPRKNKAPQSEYDLRWGLDSLGQVRANLITLLALVIWWSAC
ncbi:hypothetical protein IU438_23580 [Nocardia cyriacigeorgica]|uniref:hypothetical protein n=1 Tax=Nocardia cyriacigeorgica TaxID=135487 RepID=UPI0018935E92|nr:hypothetical protein [Nocardia cyriacigeorgica]MBF6100217.1 hypothetical protein [Nocardia cyriacigeorgica]MBF6318395.1 hypothetical protein [Nocardia cyriacigeorgica]MBF6398770.1 hypothetical protein [Nocardia cyriacigeorgica]MBF6403716.1 hypothetical protein [Nocardia cyriacigeorgica]MBF6533937.1 hypothetical protein [Nocardia cyriacigeorgica]